MNITECLINGQVNQMIIQNCFRERCSHLKIQNKHIKAEQCVIFSCLSLQEILKLCFMFILRDFVILKNVFLLYVQLGFCLFIGLGFFCFIFFFPF